MASRSHIGPVVDCLPELAVLIGERAHRLTDDEGVEHLVWGGTMEHGRIPVVNHRSLTYRVAKVTWNLYVGVPVGRLKRLTSVCKVQACVLPDHFSDGASRAARDALKGVSMAKLREQVHDLTEEVLELEERLFEHDVMKRGTLIKPSRTVNNYVLWSNNVDMPKALFYSREQALKAVARAKVARADRHGTSDRAGSFGWDDPDPSVIVDQRGLLALSDLVGFTHLYLREDEKCWELLTPLHHEN